MTKKTFFDIYFFSFPVAGPRRLRFRVMGPDKLHVFWKVPKGEYDGYRFIYTSLPGKNHDCVKGY